jgi:hypothetical protein
MAIDLFGHTTCDRAETLRRLAHARSAYPEWFDGPLFLADPGAPAPFDREIALGFGIDAGCRFGLFVHDKERLEVLGPAVDYLYRLFGTDRLVITWGLDLIRPPIAASPPQPLL